MKILSFFAFIITLGGCLGNPKNRDSFPGTYAAEVKGPYSTVWDTLAIASLGGNDYQLERKTAYQQVREGKVRPLVHHRDSTTAEWLPDKKYLLEHRHGRILTLDPAGAILHMQGTVYQRIER